MFKVGSGFLKGSEILTNCVGKTKDSGLDFPILVSMSFAAEVYLKCLLLVCNKQYPKVHNLKKLFDRLPKPDQTAISDAYENNFKNSPVFRLLMKPKCIPRLCSVLSGAGETFDEMRYSFERGKKSPVTVGLEEFVEAVQQRILVTKPELAEVLDESLIEQSRRGSK